MWNWLRTLLSGRPHFLIGTKNRPYMLRWYLVPRNPWLNVYLHKFLRDDDDRALHDHPWWFVSWMIHGRYTEQLAECTFVDRAWPSVAFRRAEHRHRVILAKDPQGEPIPCWTVVITGPKTREWGFWCPLGFVPWHVFCDREDTGSVGKGCE